MGLKPGESFCDECDGFGAIHSDDDKVPSFMCPKCKGKRRLDWVEQAVGVKLSSFESYMNSLILIGNKVKPKWEYRTSMQDIINEQLKKTR